MFCLHKNGNRFCEHSGTIQAVGHRVLVQIDGYGDLGYRWGVITGTDLVSTRAASLVSGRLQRILVASLRAFGVERGQACSDLFNLLCASHRGGTKRQRVTNNEAVRAVQVERQGGQTAVRQHPRASWKTRDFGSRTRRNVQPGRPA